MIEANTLTMFYFKMSAEALLPMTIKGLIFFLLCALSNLVLVFVFSN